VPNYSFTLNGKRVTVDAPEDLGLLYVLRDKLGVTGPYHRVAQFFANVGSLPRIVAPINVTVTPSGKATDSRQRADEQLLDAKFGIQTYVAHVAPPALTSAKPGAP